jgi:hypothetical protein
MMINLVAMRYVRQDAILSNLVRVYFTNNFGRYQQVNTLPTGASTRLAGGVILKWAIGTNCLNKLLGLIAQGNK